MFNLSQPYSGNYFKAYYKEYDETLGKYKPKREIRIRPKSDGSQGVGLNIKERVRVQVNNGWVEKSTFVVEVVENYNYKIRDKIEVVNEDKTYTIWKISDGYDSINAIANLMFPNLKSNKPYVLFLGE